MRNERVWAVVRNDIFPAEVKAVVWTAKEAEAEVKRLNNLVGVQVHYCHETVLVAKPTLEEMLERAKSYTPEESLESLKRAGIVGEDGQLTEHYRTKKKK